MAIPTILDGKDLIACAQTGTGKTAAYLLPLMDRILQSDLPHEYIKAVIIAPTRELARQIDQQLEGLSYFVPVTSYPVYGGGKGEDFVREKNALTKGADIIIATPGKLLSHLKLGYVKTEHVQFLVLDEADRMLDMGFHDDIMHIISFFKSKERQTLMFSATMPDQIRKLAKKVQQDPEEINIALSKPAEGILQAAYMAYDNQKVPLITKLVTGKELRSVIIFSSTKKNVNVITRALKKENLSVAGISSDLEQRDREELLRDFKNRKIKFVVATDVLSRGIDIEGIDLVINYDVPNDAEDYIHRVGRTARAQATGVALTLISDHPSEQRRFNQIEQLLGHEVKKLPLPPGFDDAPEYRGNRGGGGGNRRKSGGPPRGKGRR